MSLTRGIAHTSRPWLQPERYLAHSHIRRIRTDAWPPQPREFDHSRRAASTKTTTTAAAAHTGSSPVRRGENVARLQ